MLAATVDTLGELVAFPSISSETNRDIIAYLAERLESAGARCEVMATEDGAKANLFATLGPADTDGGLMLCGHTDVVPVADQPWTTDPFEMVARDGLLYGRGTCDMKGFIAACVEVAPLLADHVGNRPLHFVFTHDEEVGCLGARALAGVLKDRGLKPGLAIIGEPTSMRVIEGHKGCYEYRTEITGLEGHGSDPDRGLSAVEYAARYIARLIDLKDRLRARTPPDSRYVPPWTTINVGAVAGGLAPNVIAARAAIEWEMRPVATDDADFVKDDLAGFCRDVLLPAMHAVDPDAQIVTHTHGEVPGLAPMDRNAARDLVAELTGANATDIVAFCTEAGVFQTVGIEAVVCGPGSIEQAHKADEFVSRDQLGQCIAMLKRLAERL